MSIWQLHIWIISCNWCYVEERVESQFTPTLPEGWERRDPLGRMDLCPTCAAKKRDAV